MQDPIEKKAIVPIKFNKELINLDQNNIDNCIQSASLETFLLLDIDYKLCEISVYLTNNKEIENINRIYRKINKTTNVLSFQYGKIKKHATDKQYPGEIVISIEKIYEEAREKNIAFEYHLAHMAIHGLLHVFGYNHVKDKEAEIMERIEQSILKKLYQ